MDRTLPVVVALALVVAALAVPTVAMSGGEDELEGVTLAPSDGPNGKYAAVEDGELSVAFERLADRAVTTADDVFTITATADERIRVWIEVDGVRAYVGGDPDASVVGEENAVTMLPGDAVAVGFLIDTRGSVPDTDELTIHADAAEGEDSGGSSDAGDPEFEVVDLSAPATTTPGTPTAITATVRNGGDADGSYDAELRVDGTVVATRPVSVPAGETRTVTFQHAFDAPGEYALAVGDRRATVSVVAPETSFEVADARTDATDLVVGDATMVTATVRNVGDADGTFTAELRVAGVVVDTKDVEVPAGQAREVSFEHGFEGAGVYPVAVGDADAGEVTVRSNEGFGGRLLESSVEVTAALPVLGGLLFAFWRRR